MERIIKANFVELTGDLFFQEMSSELKNDDNVKLFKTLLERGFLTYWKIGFKNDRISSKFITKGGTEDILTSPIIGDYNYHYLLQAHLQRAFQLINEEK